MKNSVIGCIEMTFSIWFDSSKMKHFSQAYENMYGDIINIPANSVWSILSKLQSW